MEELIKKYYEKENIKYYLPLIESLTNTDNKGRKKLDGAMSNFKKIDYEKLSRGEKIMVEWKNGKKYEYKFKTSYKEAKYYELNMNAIDECIIIIDIDEDIKEEHKEKWLKMNIPEIIRELPYTLSRTKKMPHYYCILEGVSKEILIKNIKTITECLTFCKGDILASHVWEEKNSELKNYNGELPKIHINDLKKYILKKSFEKFNIEDINDNETITIEKIKELEEQTIKSNNTLNIYERKEIDELSEISEITNSTINEEKKNNINIKELKKYLNGLKEERSDNYYEWTLVVWCIANICRDNKFSSKIRNELIHDFSKKSSKYNEYNVDNFIDKSIRDEKGGLNLGSLIRWYKIDNNEDDDEELYIKYKNEHEIECFKLNNPVIYGRINVENDNIQLMKEKDMILFLKDRGYTFNNKKTFYELWSNDKNKRKYEKIIFDPHDKSNKNFNLFRGFKYDSKDSNDEILDKSNCKLILLINHLCDNNEKTISNLEDWLSRIIQHPEKKTEWAIVLFSLLGGIGKNAFIDYISKIFEGYVGKVENIEQLIDKFNSSICNKLIIYGDEVNAGAKKIADQLKSIITRKKIKMEKKGIDSIDLNDFTNYIFTTNNEHCFKIEQDDRRYFMLRCPDKKLSDEFYKELYEEMENEKILKSVFNYFKNKEILYKKNSAPETEYKKKLIYEQVPSYINMIYTNVDRYAENKYPSNKLYEESREYAKKKYLSSNYTNQSFSKDMKKILGEYYVKSNGISYYNFPEEIILKKKLYKIDPIYYRYINNFEDNEEIIFD